VSRISSKLKNILVTIAFYIMSRCPAFKYPLNVPYLFSGHLHLFIVQFSSICGCSRSGEGMADLESIQKKIISFRTERDWAQFHDPNNLAEALSIEGGELLENFLWNTIRAVPQFPCRRTQERKRRTCRHLPHLFQRGKEGRGE
jgi:hypothetical protein